MGTQVITRDSGRRLGVVGEVVVDIDRREVVALGLRDNPLTRFLPGLPRWMPLDRIRQVGDVILVDSADSLSEAFSPDRYSRVINCQVITESGQTLGRVLGFSFDIETGELTTLVMGAVGVPLLGEGVLSTWEIPVDEIVSSGADRIIVYEGAEDKLKQLSSGVLEKLGVGGPSWEEQERERYRVNIVPVENQLTSGQAVEEEPRLLEASESQSFDSERELEYVELEDRRNQESRQRRYLDEAPMQGREESYGERDRDPRVITSNRILSANQRPTANLNSLINLKGIENRSLFKRTAAISSLSAPHPHFGAANGASIRESMRILASNNAQDRLLGDRSNVPVNRWMLNRWSPVHSTTKRTNRLMIPGRERRQKLRVNLRPSF